MEAQKCETTGQCVHPSLETVRQRSLLGREGLFTSGEDTSGTFRALSLSRDRSHESRAGHFFR